MKKYYSVTAKCGHVGRYNYILKEFPIRANDGKEAAAITRRSPRVKHDEKDAIVEVRELLRDQYLDLLEEHKNDSFFKCKNIQEQRMRCVGIEEEIVYGRRNQEFVEPERSWKKQFYDKKNRIYKKESQKEARMYMQ